MAVRVVRQPKQIVVLGAPTSAAAMSMGHEKAPQALRQAGLIERLQAAGYSVTDMGDDPVETYQPDEESPRARNLGRVVASLEALKPRVEAAVKTGGLALILTGDCSSALATVAGVRRYYRGASIVYLDRDADLNVPATSPSGCVDGMVVAHLTGRGAAEMVRFWSEPPLVRDPDVALFGVSRLDAPEEGVLSQTAIRCFRAADIRKMGASPAAELAIERIHGGKNELIVHLDVDVISNRDFAATDIPGSSDGLRLDEVREALTVIVKQPRLVALEIAGYNPERDADGRGAKIIVELLTAALDARLQAQTEQQKEKEQQAAATPAAENENKISEPTARAEETPSATASDADASSGAQGSSEGSSAESESPEHLTSTSNE